MPPRRTPSGSRGARPSPSRSERSEDDFEAPRDARAAPVVDVLSDSSDSGSVTPARRGAASADASRAPAPAEAGAASSPASSKETAGPDGPSGAASTMRSRFAEIARRRAAHFARQASDEPAEKAGEEEEVVEKTRAPKPPVRPARRGWGRTAQPSGP